ncbi:hypothetical protein [Chromobacterium sp. Rain0013]|nr:hypothetical protein [Chromobacterium sp. Rain0013]
MDRRAWKRRSRPAPAHHAVSLYGQCADFDAITPSPPNTASR